ncbi:DUF397 domain-containing protein [Spirillospora sp. NPDC052269]
MMEASGPRWRKSSRSHADGDQCVELAAADDGVLIRDSKDVTGAWLTLDRSGLRAVMNQIKTA